MIIGRGRVQGCQWNKGFRSSFSFSFAFSLFIFYFLILSFFSGGVCFGYKWPRATIRIGSAGPAGLFGLGYMHNIQSL
jgi:hypothetical protein